MNIKKIWQNKFEILEGIKNSVFKKEAVEEIAEERFKECLRCPHIDKEGTKCDVQGTQPCCGDCGCSLKFKTRSLSSSCPKDVWDAVITEDEEIALDELNPE